MYNMSISICRHVPFVAGLNILLINLYACMHMLVIPIKWISWFRTRSLCPSHTHTPHTIYIAITGTYQPNLLEGKKGGSILGHSVTILEHY